MLNFLTNQYCTAWKQINVKFKGSTLYPGHVMENELFCKSEPFKLLFHLWSQCTELSNLVECFIIGLCLVKIQAKKYVNYTKSSLLFLLTTNTDIIY
jgi:hypothetical protein